MSHDYFESSRVRDSYGFYLVQRLKLDPWNDRTKAFYGREGVSVKSNPFGYGRLGDFELDYMGSAEFEFGTIPAAYKRFEDQELEVETGIEIPGVAAPLDFLYIKKEGEPFTAFNEWCKGAERVPALYGKERPYDFEKKAGVGQPPEVYEYGGDLWWALGANVIFGITADNMLGAFLDGLAVEDKPRELRG